MKKFLELLYLRFIHLILNDLGRFFGKASIAAMLCFSISCLLTEIYELLTKPVSLATLALAIGSMLSTHLLIELMKNYTELMMNHNFPSDEE